MKIICVTWLDSSYTREATTPVKLEPMILHTVGYLIVDDVDKVVLAAEVDDEEPFSYRDVTAIPKVCVQKVVELVRLGTAADNPIYFDPIAAVAATLSKEPWPGPRDRLPG